MPRYLCFAALVVALGGAAESARCAPVFTLDPAEKAGVRLGAERAARWAVGKGRFGGPALAIVPKQEGVATRLVLLREARPLASPNQCRVEAWVRGRAGQCHIDLVLYHAATGSAGQRVPLASIEAYRTLARDEPPLPWRYMAADFALPADQGPVRFNIELSVLSGPVLVDRLRVLGAESMVANGDFLEVEPGFTAASAGAAAKRMANVPRGWRRYYAARSGGRRAAGVFKVERTANGSRLNVHKEAGRFTLSSEPIALPSGVGAWVARAYAETADGPLPRLVLRQIGRRGLLREDRSDRVSPYGKLAVVSTGRLSRHPRAERLLLLLDFPEPAGTYRVRRVEIPLLARQRTMQIFVDQVGYDTGVPLRFIVATSRFPTDGVGRFELTRRDGHGYRGPLVPLGRTLGQNDADWGSYYFEGAVRDPQPGSYALTASVGDRSVSIDAVCVGRRLHVHETGPLAYRFYSVQRCGCEVPGWHGLCHMDDGRLPDGTHVDVTGGYHNAGDFHKHMGDNTPVSVYGMISAYEKYTDFFRAIDADGNGRGDLLDEVLWGADWLLKMVDPKTGRIWMNVTNDIDYFGIPELDTDGKPGTGDDRLINPADPSDLGAFTIAAWAALSRHVADDKYRVAAEKLWSVYEDRIATAHNPRHVLAALELWRTTHRERYRSMAGRLARNLLVLQSADGWYATSPGAGPALRIVDEGTTPAALAAYVLAQPEGAGVERIKASLRSYFAWSLRMGDHPFGVIRHDTGDGPFFFKSRDAWFGGENSAYCSTAWAAFLAARVFADDPVLARQLRVHAANQQHWILGLNPLNLCMFEGCGNSRRIKFHHLYAEIPGHPRGAVPGAIPNGIIREPGNADRPWFDFRSGVGSLPGAESAEPWLPHNAYYLLMLSAGD